MINNSQKIVLFDYAKRLGHPDPEGLLARMAVESNYNEDKVGDDGRIGLSQVDPKLAEDLGLEIESVTGNTNAAIIIDLQNLEEVDNDLPKMYAKWRGHKGKKAEDYNNSIDAKRDDVKADISPQDDEGEMSDNEKAYSKSKLVDRGQLRSLLGLDDVTPRPLYRDPANDLILTIVDLIDRV